MILYLSSQQHTNLLDFLSEKEDSLPVKKMTGNFMLKQFVIYDMRNFSHCTELVLDRIAFGDEDRDFAQAIEEFLTMYNARITVICEGLKESDPLCLKGAEKTGREGRALSFQRRWCQNCHDKLSEPYRYDYYGVGLCRVAWKRRCKCGLCGKERQRHHSLSVGCL